jgi:hypothetical protein
MHRYFIVSFLLVTSLQAFSADGDTGASPDESSRLKNPSGSMQTRVISGPFPMNVTLPMEFADATKILYDGKSLPHPHPDFAIYCDPADVQLMLAQFLKGERLNDKPNKGCLTVATEKSSIYDTVTQPAITQALEDQRRNLERMSGPHRNDMVILNFSKHTFRGAPAMTFLQDFKHRNREARIRFLYLVKDDKVWVVTHESARDDSVSASIWERFIAGL